MDNLVKGVQCYELFGGVALKNHASFFIELVLFKVILYAINCLV